MSAVGLSAARPSRWPPVSILIAALILVVVAVWVLIPGVVAPEDSEAISVTAAWQTPSGAHLLGTDDLGRDIFSRMVDGTRAAVLGPILIAFGSALLGTVLGAVAAYYGRWTDTTISRATDVLFALPALLIVIVVVGVVQGSYLVSVGVLTILYVPITLRLIRAATMEQRVKPYVEAARLQGASSARILRVHILPNLAPIAGSALFLNFTYGLIGLAALSFLGFGSSEGDAAWGRMLAENRIGLSENPMASLGPGLALVLTAVAVNLLGDYVYERHASRGRAR